MFRIKLSASVFVASVVAHVVTDGHVVTAVITAISGAVLLVAIAKELEKSGL